MKTRLNICFAFLLLINYSFAQNYSTYFVGHSLVGHTLPDMLDQLALSKGINYSSKRQIINGAPLKYNWENPEQGEIGNYTLDLSTGNYNTLILTEAIPLDNHIMWSDTHVMATNFYNYFDTYVTNGTTYIYETWHCINSGTAVECAYDNGDAVLWRDRLDIDLSKWEAIANYINAQNSSANTKLIPAGQAMALLYDKIALNNLNGITSLADFFTDDIHLNDLGNYYIACVMFATLFNTTPEGLTSTLSNSNGTLYNTPNATLANQLQELALQSVCNYQTTSAGNCQVLNIKNNDNNGALLITLEPETITLASKTSVITKYNIYNMLGVPVKTKLYLNKKKATIKTPSVKKGVYILSVTLSSGLQQRKKIML